MRSISLSVKNQGSLLSIHEENYYTGKLKKAATALRPRKRKRAATAKDHVFNIHILLPLPERN